VIRATKKTAVTLQLSRCAVVLAATLWVMQGYRANAQATTISIDTDQVIGHVDTKIYGQFLEHIYHSVNGGIWGQLVFDRSFEEELSKDDWMVRGDEVSSPAVATSDSRFAIGSEAWKDFDATIELRRTSPAGSVTVSFRVTGKNGYFIALGVDSNQHYVLGLTRGNYLSDKIESEQASSVAGGLEQNKWYRLHIRCEGAHAQVWLDGRLLFESDHVDRPNGQIVLGVSDSAATFRNIKVASLDGAPLSEETPSPARHWAMVGTPTASMDHKNPLNSAVSLKLTADGSGEGVQQHHLAVRQGDTLRGSIWLRGAAPAGVTVRLMDGTKELAGQHINGIGSEWKEFALKLYPPLASAEATLQIVSVGKATLWIDQISLTPDSSLAHGGFRPDLLKAMADLHPAIVRWPGGSFVGNYNWKQTIGPQEKRIGKRGWDEWDPLDFGVDEYMQLMRTLDAEPLIVIYMGPQGAQDRTKFIQDARDFVEYCNGPATSTWGRKRAENGHPEPYRVKYWEIDNEVWGTKTDNYVKAIRDFGAAMKAVDPTISLIACGSGNFGGQWGEGDIAIIDQVADLVDYLSIHRYEGADRFASGPSRAELFWGQLAQRIAQSKNPKMKLFVSEWNAQSTDWRTGLYAGGELNAFEESPIVGMATPALWLRHVTAPSLDNAFINFDQSRWFPAPNYVVMKLYRDHFEPNLLRVTGAPPEVNIVATESSDRKDLVLKMVNTSDKAMDVHVRLSGSFLVTGGTWFQIAPDSLTAKNSLEPPNEVHPTESKMKCQDHDLEVDLPRWSVNVLSLQAR
jgi:alpha-N-arabinofuranosidase